MAVNGSYTFVAKTLHWSVALIIFGLLAAGFFMTTMDFSPEKLELYSLHKSFGLLVLALGIARILWRIINPPPAALATHKPWEKALSKLAHFLLYAAIILMPLSGWVMSSAGDFPNSFFGLFEMPDLTGKNEDIYKISKEVHEITAFIILGVLILHSAGAFKHHFIDRDKTLARMSYQDIGLTGAGILLVFTGLLFLLVFGTLILPRMKPNANEQVSATYERQAEKTLASTSGDAANLWAILPEKSFIQFTATQYGQEFSGHFKNFTGLIRFDPQNLEQSHADITIDITSIETGSADRDQQALGKEWFHTESFPKARFVTQSFLETAPNEYEAKADLSIRDQTKSVTLPFSLQIEKARESPDTAIMKAMLSLDRVDWGVGAGQWEDGQAIGKEVKILVHVEAERRP